MPPADAFEKIASYANENGKESGKPYFSINGTRPITYNEWKKLRAKFYCPVGVTNVWHVPQLRGSERLKSGQKAVHLNQKPLKLIRQIIQMSSDETDVIWDPFAGLCTTAVAAVELNRTCYCAEINRGVFGIAEKRVTRALRDFIQDQKKLCIE